MSWFRRARRSEARQGGRTRNAPTPVAVLFLDCTQRDPVLDVIVQDEVIVDGRVLPAGTPAGLRCDMRDCSGLLEWLDGEAEGARPGAPIALAEWHGGDQRLRWEGNEVAALIC